MSTETTTQTGPHADLAFLKALVEGDGRREAAFGAAYLLAGIGYGVQIILQWLDFAKILPLPQPLYLAVVSIPTVALIAFSAWQGWRLRKMAVPNAASRAVDAMFNGAGLANLAVIAAIVAAAIGQRAYMMILVYPAVLFAFQGACWFVVYRVRKRAWMLAVALAWLASGVGMGVALGAMQLHAYIAIATFDLWVLMALPGWLMLRHARKGTAS
jgi:hypothetical protein